MRSAYWLLLVLLVPLAAATTEELVVTSCDATGCNVSELNTLNNVSGTTVSKNEQQTTGMSALSRDVAIDSFSAALSHDADAGITGSWTVDFRSATDQTVWCSESTPHSDTWTLVTLAPTGCAWTAQRLQDLEIAFTNNDQASPQSAYVDFINATVTYTLQPQISNVTHSSVTSDSADVSWDTNNSANATLEYGSTQALGTTRTNTTPSTNHFFSLTNLSDDTTYYYNVTSCTADACETQGPFSFTTPKAIAPTISDVQVAAGETAANISWQVDRSADATVRYGTSTSYGTTLTNDTNNTTHSFTLTGLSAATTYHYEVESCDELGCAQEQGIFKTAPPIGRCAYRYAEKGPGHEPGLVKQGDVVVLDCRLENPIHRSQELRVQALWPAAQLTRIVTTPRLLHEEPEVLYP